MTERRFDGAAVLITGAARGFGRLAAERFAAEGAKLVISDILANELETAAGALREAGAQVVAIPGDVSLEETAKKLVAASVDAYGRLDVAVNNAGIAHPLMKLADIDGATMERVFRVNVFSVFYALKHQLPQMERQGKGVILNVASVAGLIGAPLLGVYAASKHGVVGLTRTAAAEYARSGIRVNAICPAFASTPMVTDILSHMKGDVGEAVARTVALVPMRRIAEPAEIVQAMLWLCSPENSFMTGHTLAVDGGLSAI